MAGIERAPARPERTLYALTDAGRVELRERVVRLLTVPDPDATLLTAALSFVGVLPVPEAAEALRARHTELARRHNTGVNARADAAAVPRMLLVEVEYEIARLAAERDFVASLVADLDAGELAWPADLRELEEIAMSVQAEVAAVLDSLTAAWDAADAAAFAAPFTHDCREGPHSGE